MFGLNIYTITKIIRGFENHPFFVFICGGSCSGKTYLANQLAKSFDDFLIISMDNYYKNQNDLTLPKVNGKTSFDLPESFRLEDLKKDIQSLFLGSCIELPLFNVHKDEVTQTRTVFPAKYIFIEGLYSSLVSDVILTRSQKLVIKLESDVQNVFNRRVKRDMGYGLSFDQAVEVFKTFVEPAYGRYINQQKADLILKNNFEKV